MIGTSASWPITVRIAVSWVVGVVAAVLVFLGGVPTGRSMSIGSLLAGAVQAFAAVIILTPLLLIVTGPLFAIAIISGLLFRRSIERHLLAWSFVAPGIVWLFVCVTQVLTWRNQYSSTRDFLDRLGVTIREIENLLMFFGAFVSGLAFYVLSATRQEPPVDADDVPMA